jgi:hypothetical protein
MHVPRVMFSLPQENCRAVTSTYHEIYKHTTALANKKKKIKKVKVR